MKKLMAIACVALAAALVGCKSVPTTGTMYTTSYAIGAAAGLIANETKIDDTTRNTVCEIVNIVSQCVPATNETFETAWTPIAQAHVNKLIADGKIDEGQGKLIMSAFGVAVKGIDYVFVKYPKAKQYEELVVAAIDGFSDGFLTVFKPVNGSLRGAPDVVGYDAEAYRWLKANAK